MISFEMSSSSSPIDSVVVVSGAAPTSTSISASLPSGVQPDPLSSSSSIGSSPEASVVYVNSSSSSSSHNKEANNKLLLNKMFENFVNSESLNNNDEIVKELEECASDEMEYFLGSSPSSSNSSSSSSSLSSNSHSLNQQPPSAAATSTTTTSCISNVCENISDNVCQQELSTTTFFSPFKSPKHRCPLNSKIDDLMTSPILNSGVKRVSVLSSNITENICGMDYSSKEVVIDDLSPIEQCRKPSPLVNDSMNSSGPFLSPSQPKITNWFSSRIQTPGASPTNNGLGDNGKSLNDSSSNESLSRSMRIFKAAKKSMTFTVTNSNSADCDLIESSNSQPISSSSTSSLTSDSSVKTGSNSQQPLINHRLKRALSYQDSSSTSPSSVYRKSVLGVGSGKTSPFPLPLSRGSECLKALNKDGCLKTTPVTVGASSPSVSIYPIFTTGLGDSSPSSKPLSSVENTELNESSSSSPSSEMNNKASCSIVGILRKTPPSTPLSSSSAKKRKAVIFTDPLVSSQGFFDTASTKVISVISPRAAKRPKLDLTIGESNDSAEEEEEDGQDRVNSANNPEVEKNVECIRLRSRRVSRNCINLFKTGFNNKEESNNKDDKLESQNLSSETTSDSKSNCSSSVIDASNSEVQTDSDKVKLSTMVSDEETPIEVDQKPDCDSSILDEKLDNLQTEINEMNCQLTESNDEARENLTTTDEMNLLEDVEDEPLQIEESLEEIVQEISETIDKEESTKVEENHKELSETITNIVVEEKEEPEAVEEQVPSMNTYQESQEEDEASFILVPESPVNEVVDQEEEQISTNLSEDDKIEEISESSQESDDLSKSPEPSTSVSTSTSTIKSTPIADADMGISICNSAYLPRSLSMLKAAKRNPKVSRVFVETLRFAESPTKSSQSSSTEQNNSSIISSSSSHSQSSSPLRTVCSSPSSHHQQSNGKKSTTSGHKSPQSSTSCLMSMRRGSVFLQAAKLKQAEKLSSHQQQLVDQSESIQITTSESGVGCGGSETVTSAPKSILKVLSKVRSERKKTVIFTEPVVSRQLFFDSSISSLFTCDNISTTNNKQPSSSSRSFTSVLSSSISPPTTVADSSLSQDKSSLVRLKPTSATSLSTTSTDKSLNEDADRQLPFAAIGGGCDDGASSSGDNEDYEDEDGDNGIIDTNEDQDVDDELADNIITDDIHNGSQAIPSKRSKSSSRRNKIRHHRNRLFHQNSTFEYCDNFVIVQSNNNNNTTNTTTTTTSTNTNNNQQSVVCSTVADSDESATAVKQIQMELEDDNLVSNDDESTISIDNESISMVESSSQDGNQQQTDLSLSKDVDNRNSMIGFEDSLMNDDDEDEEDGQTIYCSMSYKNFSLDQVEDNTDGIEWNVEDIVDSDHVESRFSDDEVDEESIQKEGNLQKEDEPTVTNDEKMEVTESDPTATAATLAPTNIVATSSSTPSTGSSGSAKSYSSSQDYSEQPFSIYTQQFAKTVVPVPDQTTSLLDEESSPPFGQSSSLFDRLISSEELSESTVTTSRCIDNPNNNNNNSNSGSATIEIQNGNENIVKSNQVESIGETVPDMLAPVSIVVSEATTVPTTTTSAEAAAAVPTAAADVNDDDNKFVYIRMPLGLAKQFYHYFGQVFEQESKQNGHGSNGNNNNDDGRT